MPNVNVNGVPTYYHSLSRSGEYTGGLMYHGVVEMWGKIVVHSAGYRAQFAQIVSAWPSTVPSYGLNIYELVCDRYGLIPRDDLDLWATTQNWMRMGELEWAPFLPEGGDSPD
jgi:hypothetical protein